MSKIKLLLAEDDLNLGDMLQEFLEVKGFSCTLARDGEAAWELYTQNQYDFIILDVMMPKLDGFELGKRIRSGDENTPILYLTAKNLKEDRLEGFKIGADDYMSKPFSMEELRARIEAILKRTGVKSKEVEKSIYQIDNWSFNIKSGEITTDQNEVIKLSGKESAILRYMCMKGVGELIDRNELLKYVWNDDSYFSGRSMDVYISKIRKILKPNPNIEIKTIHGEGLRLIIK